MGEREVHGCRPAPPPTESGRGDAPPHRVVYDYVRHDEQHSPANRNLRSLVPPLPRFPLASNATDYDERGVYRYRMADDTAAAARPSPRGQLRLHRQIVTFVGDSSRGTPHAAPVGEIIYSVGRPSWAFFSP